jgi:hypothetical protein
MFDSIEPLLLDGRHYRSVPYNGSGAIMSVVSRLGALRFTKGNAAVPPEYDHAGFVLRYEAEQALLVSADRLA